MRTVAHYSLRSAITTGLVRVKGNPAAASPIVITTYDKSGKKVSRKKVSVADAGLQFDEYGYGASYSLPNSKHIGVAPNKRGKK